MPALRFPEFGGEWEEKRLGDVGEIITGSTPPTNERGHYDGEYLFVSPFDIQDNRYVENTKTTLTKSGFLNGRKVKKGSSLFVCIGSTIGKVAQAKHDCTTNQQINSVISTSNNDDFVFSLLQFHSSRIQKLQAEQAVPILNKTTFSNYVLSIPTISEQNKIANFLTAVDEKLQALKKKKALLEQYKKGVMQKIFSQELRFKDENGNDFADWEVKRLGDAFYCEKGKGLSKEKLSATGINECILYGELYTKYSEVVFSIVSKTNENEGLRSQIGDLLIPCSTTTTGIDLANITALNKEGVLLGGDITVLRSSKKINNIFYAYYLSNHKKEEIASYAQGSTIVHLYFGHIKDMAIDLPSFLEQQKIANFLTNIDEKINQQQNQIEKVSHYKKGLLQQMFC